MDSAERITDSKTGAVDVVVEVHEEAAEEEADTEEVVAEDSGAPAEDQAEETGVDRLPCAVST